MFLLYLPFIIYFKYISEFMYLVNLKQCTNSNKHSVRAFFKVCLGLILNIDFDIKEILKNQFVSSRSVLLCLQ